MTDQYDSEYPAMGPGDQIIVRRDGHTFVVVSLSERGIHSGRTKFLVACGTCCALIHASTTSPIAQFERHIRQAEDDEVGKFVNRLPNKGKQP